MSAARFFFLLLRRFLLLFEWMSIWLFSQSLKSVSSSISCPLSNMSVVGRGGESLLIKVGDWSTWNKSNTTLYLNTAKAWQRYAKTHPRRPQWHNYSTYMYNNSLQLFNILTKSTYMFLRTNQSTWVGKCIDKYQYLFGPTVYLDLITWFLPVFSTVFVEVSDNNLIGNFK